MAHLLQYAYGLSILIYIAAVITVSVELYYASLWFSATCFSAERSNGYSVSVSFICWPFFLVAWCLALPGAVLGVVCSTAFLARLRPAAPVSRAAVWSHVAITTLLLAALLIGWIPPQLGSEDELPSGDGFGGSVATGYLSVNASPPVTGIFSWIVDVYNAVMPYANDNFVRPSNNGDIFNALRVGMAAVVLVTMAFSWSVIMAILVLVYRYGSKGAFVPPKPPAAVPAYPFSSNPVPAQPHYVQPSGEPRYVQTKEQFAA